jgi:GTP cyclohydrolase II/3,4-dihydroxy 2-butanone 4-phosphate synthase/GTP cyclohydrolase II
MRGARPAGRRDPKKAVERFSESELPTPRGTFRILVYLDGETGLEHVALVRGDVRGREDVLVRVHSECLTSEVFGSLRCDCRAQLDRALDAIAERGFGVLVYLRQEGRGIGLGNKIRAYALQQQRGLDTVEANLELGFEVDLRRYDVAGAVLRDLGVRSVEVMTNNPAKIDELVKEGVVVRRRIPSSTQPNPENEDYLRTKRDRCGHLIDIVASDPLHVRVG